MNTNMRLNEKSFNLIKNNQKTIEYRLNDEKRQKLKVGDTITFYKLPDKQESIRVIIKELKYYKNLLAMFTECKDQYFKDKDPQEKVNETTFYSEEDIQKYGCIAIVFQRLD